MVSVAHHWNTWDQTDPLSMVHLPTGLCLRFSCFSNKEGIYRLLGVGTRVALLEHTADGSFVRAGVAHAGSEMELIFLKLDPHAVSAHLRVLRTGEWGLRYWLALEVGFLDFAGGPVPWRAAEPWMAVEPTEPVPPAEHPRLLGRHRSRWISVVSREPAVFGGSYASIENFESDLNHRGYYAPPRADQPARWGVLRFNAQMHPEITIAAAFGTDRQMAMTAADALAISAGSVVADATVVATRETAAYQAVRDVIAWNTIWDPQNHRPTIVLTRNWLSKKFSGWGVWLDDMMCHALLAALVGDYENARASFEAAVEYLCPAGNLPCLRTATQEWVDRSQSPIGAYILWRIFELTGDRTLLAQHFPVLLRAHHWWITTRDPNGDGLIEFGSSPTGTGAFVHTKQAAMDESLMDNAPIFDEAAFNADTHTLTMAEPGLSSLVSMDAQFLARIAAELGDATAATELHATAERINRRIAELLWDDERGTFAGRHWSGAFARSLSATCFLPLLAGAASDAQAATMIERYLLQTDQFGGERLLPSSAHSDPASQDDVYWRGRIWPPHVFLVWEALRRQGRYDLATELAARAWRMFEEGWAISRACRENYHRQDAAGDDTPDSDSFYSWGALIPAIRMLDQADRSPWEGLVFSPDAGGSARLTEAGRNWEAVREQDKLRLSMNGTPIIVTTGVGRLRLLSHSRGSTCAEVVPRPGAAEVSLTLVSIDKERLRAVELNGEPVSPTFADGSLRLTLPGEQRSRVQIWHSASSCGFG
jgi:putative isomerase